MTVTTQKPTKEKSGGPTSPKASRERRLFDALRRGSVVKASELSGVLARCGLGGDDPRLAGTMRLLERHGPDAGLDYDRFRAVVKPGLLLIERALQGRMMIPDFGTFCSELREIHAKTASNTAGAVADYIPQLARVNPDQFGAAVCSVDGQRHSVGDAGTDFCVQSCCKPLNYCLALEEHGEPAVHERIGCEPSGRSFNELSLNHEGRPHNPMINSGAIMSCSLIRPGLGSADRFDHVIESWTALSGGSKPKFSNPTYLSERGTADRNFALGYFMREQGGFPEGTDLVETLEFYFQCCSLEMTAESISIVAATLANGGICPTTGERVLKPGTVQNCLSLMYSCGMYDYSGEWAFAVGLPAKSGVSGAILVVVPNVLGLCIWSPRLDGNGNSVRGIDFCRELVRRFNFHNYDNLVGVTGTKRDPRLAPRRLRSDHLVDLCWAASEGDLDGIRRLVARGAELDGADYDGRTALHLAASEGHPEVVSYFLGQGARPDPTDRWGATPLDDAVREGHDDVADLLRPV